MWCNVGRSLALLLLLASNAWAADTTWDLRFRFSPSQPDALAPGVQYTTELSTVFSFAGAAQLAFSPKEIRHVAYQAGFTYTPWSVLRLQTTLFHLVLPSAGAGWTGLTLRAVFNLPVVSGVFDFYGAFGWYERFSRASGEGLLPLPLGQMEREHDILVQLGCRTHFSERWAAELEVATFDDYEIFNLNGPYIQLAVDHKSAAAEKWRTYARYHMLLGFGRIDELAVGAEVQLLH